MEISDGGLDSVRRDPQITGRLNKENGQGENPRHQDPAKVDQLRSSNLGYSPRLREADSVDLSLEGQLRSRGQAVAHTRETEEARTASNNEKVEQRDNALAGYFRSETEETRAYRSELSEERIETAEERIENRNEQIAASARNNERLRDQDERSDQEQQRINDENNEQRRNNSGGVDLIV